ncbi:hypothetical protein [Nonlabens xylanidelens]|nr:hypothetical protein [Nonlabens xylanidelens]PQJ19551.1 hypothetical protein BST94_06615 [Nonlabens xylanidelens]
MIDLKIILFSIIWLNLCSCKEVKNNEDTYTEEDKVYQLRKKNIQVSCLILRNIDSTAAIVQDKGAKSIITDSTDDNCLLQYVDSISTRLIKSPKKIYFKN